MMKTVFKTVCNDAEVHSWFFSNEAGIQNATYEDQGNLLSHTSIQPLMVYTLSDILLQTYGTN